MQTGKHFQYTRKGAYHVACMPRPLLCLTGILGGNSVLSDLGDGLASQTILTGGLRRTPLSGGVQVRKVAYRSGLSGHRSLRIQSASRPDSP